MYLFLSYFFYKQKYLFSFIAGAAVEIPGKHKSRTMYIRVSKNAPFSVKHSMAGGKRKLE